MQLAFLQGYYLVSIKKDKEMSSKHRLCVDLISNQEHDLLWAYSMDKAIIEAVIVMRFGLEKHKIQKIHQNFMELIPKEGDPESLSNSAFQYYSTYYPKENTPWKIKDICDFILAYAHRKYTYEHNYNYWINSKFKAVPVGIPRTKNISKNARNYTPHGIKNYKSYCNFLKKGVLIQNLDIYYYENRSLIKSKSSTQKVELTETTDTHWLHTRIINLPIIWEHLENLLQKLISLEKQQKHTQDKLINIIGLIAQIHWWFSHAMPYRRGSAAIGDMLSKVLFEYHNISTACWKRGKSPDLEAFCSSLEEYIENYQSYFNYKPQFLC